MKGLGVKSMIYHAGLSPDRRSAAHHKFVRDEVQVGGRTIFALYEQKNRKNEALL